MVPLTISQAAAAAGVTAHTARYYEAQGLIPPVRRDGAGRRVFDEVAVAWLEYAVCLRGLGMPATDVARYVAAASGPSPDTAARAIMARHLEAMRAKRDDLDRYIEVIERKLTAMDAPR